MTGGAPRPDPPRFEVPRPDFQRPEFHRPLKVDRVGPDGLAADLRATEAECAALAARMAVPAVTNLACRFRLSAAPGQVVLAEGHLQALVVRDCVLTLERFESVVDEHFRLRFVPAGSEADDDDPETDDEIAYAGSSIDLGEAAAEQLALTLDPYPRKPGATLPDVPLLNVPLLNVPVLNAPPLNVPLQGGIPRDDGGPDSPDGDPAVEAPRSPFAALARLRRPG